MRSVARTLPMGFIFVTASFGCKPPPPPETALQTDVFVVTKSGQSVKLGLVTVAFYPANAVEPLVASELKRASEALSQLEVERQNAEHVVAQKKLDAKSDELMADTAHDLWLKSIRLGNHKLTDEMHAALEERRAKYKATLDAQLAALKAVRDVLLREQRFESGAFFWEALPKPAISGKTDADGRTVVRLTPGRYAVAALSDRQVGGDHERYVWYVWTTVAGEPTKKIMLSNDNLAETNCDDCVLPLKTLQRVNAPTVNSDAGVAAASVGQ